MSQQLPNGVKLPAIGDTDWGTDMNDNLTLLDNTIGGLGSYAKKTDTYTKTEVNDKLTDYYPASGGTLTGNLIQRNTDSDHLGISGAYWGHGAYLWLSGQNSGYGGSWYLSARDSEKSCDLVGSPSGVLSWGGKLIATEDTLTNYYTKSEVDGKLVSVYKYVGTVATVNDLPTTSTIGYVYNVLDTGMNYAWDGSKWDPLGSEIDLSNYVKNTDFATSNKGGVFKFSQSHGITMSSDGFLMGATRTAEQYASNSGNMLINKGTLENVLTSKSETWEFTLSDGSTVTKKIVCM